MNDSDFVGGVESSTDLDHDRKDSVHRQRLGVTLLDAENLRQRRTFDEFHRQELFAQVFADVVHPRAVRKKPSLSGHLPRDSCARFPVMKRTSRRTYMP